MFKKYLVSIFLFCIMANSFAADRPSPIELLEQVSKQAIQQIKAQDAQHDRKAAKRIINKVLLPHVDMKLMSQKVLGKYWDKATPAQQKQFTQQFSDLLANTYASALMAYSNEKIKYYPIRGGYADKEDVQVRSDVISNAAQPMPIVYWLHYDNTWKVYDLSVEGVSLLDSFRSQLTEEARKGGMPAVIKLLEEHNKKQGQA